MSLPSWLALILAEASIIDRSMHVRVSCVRLDRLFLYCVGEGERIARIWSEVVHRRVLIEWIARARWELLDGAVRDLPRVVYLHVHRVRIVLRLDRRETLIQQSCMEMSFMNLRKKFL